MSSVVATSVTPAPPPSGRAEAPRADRGSDDRFDRLVGSGGDIDATASPRSAPPRSAPPRPAASRDRPSKSEDDRATADAQASAPRKPPAPVEAQPKDAKSAAAQTPASATTAKDAASVGTANTASDSDAAPGASDAEPTPGLAPIPPPPPASVFATAVPVAPAPAPAAVDAVAQAPPGQAVPASAAPTSSVQAPAAGAQDPDASPQPGVSASLDDKAVVVVSEEPSLPLDGSVVSTAAAAQAGPAPVASRLPPDRPTSARATASPSRYGPSVSGGRGAASIATGAASSSAPTPTPSLTPSPTSAALVVAAQAAEAEGGPVTEADPAPAAPDPSAPAGAAPTTAFAPDAAPSPAPPAQVASSTVAAFASQVVKRLDQRASRFDVTLDPAGLGRVSVAMEIGGDGALTARLAFERADAAHLVGAHAQDLHQALADAGFKLSVDAIRFDVTPQASPAGSSGVASGAGAGGSLNAGFGGSQAFDGRNGAAGRPVRSFAAGDDLGLDPSAYASGTAAGGLDIRI